MTTPTKNHTEHKAEAVPQAPKPAQQKPADALADKAKDIFAKIKSKTGIDSKKIDEFQKSWLAVPENRKKYEHIADAPEVTVEEILAMTNDIIDYCQGQDSHQSHIFKNLKEKGAKFLHGPIETLKQTFTKGKQAAGDANVKTKESAEMAKPVAEQPKAKNNQAKAVAKKNKK